MTYVPWMWAVASETRCIQHDWGQRNVCNHGREGCLDRPNDCNTHCQISKSQCPSCRTFCTTIGIKCGTKWSCWQLPSFGSCKAHWYQLCSSCVWRTSALIKTTPWEKTTTIDHFHRWRYRNTHYELACPQDSCPSVEYHKYGSELEFALDRYTHSRCRLWDHWNHRRKSEEKGRNAVHKRLEVEYYRAQSQNQHLPVVWLILIQSFVSGCDGGEGSKCRCKSTSSSSEDTVDEDPCFVSKIKCCSYIKKPLDNPLSTHTISSRLVLGKSRTSIYIFQKGDLPLIGFLSSFYTRLQRV